MRGGLAVLVGIGCGAAQPGPAETWPQPRPGWPTLHAFHRDAFRNFQVSYPDITSCADARTLAHRPEGVRALD